MWRQSENRLIDCLLQDQFQSLKSDVDDILGFGYQNTDKMHISGGLMNEHRGWFLVFLIVSLIGPLK